MRKIYTVYAVRHRNGEWHWHGYTDPDKVPKRLEKKFICRVDATTEIAAIYAAMDHRDATLKEAVK